MAEGFAWWLFIAGIGVGIAIAWLVTGRLTRADDDVGEEERAAEAAWISRSISSYGGVAPPALVEEILVLHRHYLQGPGIEPQPDEALPVFDAVDEVSHEERPGDGADLADDDLARADPGSVRSPR